jgi:hypothetical protein
VKLIPYLYVVLKIIISGVIPLIHSSHTIFRVIKSRKIRWAGHVARMGDGRGVYRVLVGKLEEKRTLGGPRRRWVDNIKADF